MTAARIFPVAALLFLLCLPAALIAAPPKPKPVLHKGREILALDGVWKFVEVSNFKSAQPDWNAKIPQDAKETAVPSLWKSGSSAGAGSAAWYWREFDAPAAWKGQTLRLHFGAVAGNAQVWFNGTSLGAHESSVVPFEYNVTKSVRLGEKNLVAVHVEGRRKEAAGIWQSVSLFVHDEAYLDDYFAQGNGYGNLNVAITLLNTSQNAGGATLEGHITAATDPKREIVQTHQNIQVTPGRNITLLLASVRGKKLKGWSPEAPALYTVQLLFRQGDDILDSALMTFGFREFGLQDGTITLNGQPIKLTAMALQQSEPVVFSSTVDVEKARLSLRHLKEKGVSVIYLSAPSPTLLQIADEEGIFVVESARPGLGAEAAFAELQALIRRDRSHASILGWSLGDANKSAAQTIRQLDLTRFLLVGPETAPKLWPPSRNEPATGPLPAGLLP